MDKIIQEITEKFSEQLPENEEFFTAESLEEYGFPRYLVERIRVELEHNLDQSLQSPQSDWADMNDPAVKTAWARFVNATHKNVRLPAGYASAIVETAVADCLEILVQPAQNIPEVVFGMDKELDRDLLTERLRLVTVYKYFPRLIQRYVQKKDLNSLAKERCRKVIAEADRMLTANYSPLNWAQALEPLFSLLDGEVDTDLLRLYFEDKNLQKVAKHFDRLPGSVSRAEFIDELSSPDLLGFEGDENTERGVLPEEPPSNSNSALDELKKTAQTIENDKVAMGEETRERDDDSGTASLGGLQHYEGESSDAGFEQKEEEEEEEPEDETAEEVDRDEDPILSSFHRSKRSGAEQRAAGGLEEEIARAGRPEPKEPEFTEDPDTETDEEKTSVSINEIFGGLEEEEIQQEDEDVDVDDEEEETEGYDYVEESPFDDEEKEEGEEDDRTVGLDELDKEEEFGEKREIETVAEDEGEDNGEEETPMWMRFMSEEEMEAFEAEQEKRRDENENIEDSTDEEEEPIIDLAGDGDEELRELQKNLRQKLADEEQRFIDNIFGGSDHAFEQAVDEIATHDSWKEASAYIEKEIFKRNMVDMYSETAVEFTDRLQTFFLEKSN